MTLSSDPRAGIKDLLSGGKTPPKAFHKADYLHFDQMTPAEAAHQQTWWGRGQNFLVAYTRAEVGAVLETPALADEHMLVLPDAGTAATLEAGGRRHQIGAETLTIVPPGPARLEVTAPGIILRIFTTTDASLAARAANAANYDRPDPNTAPLVPWPRPRGGHGVRSHSLAVPPVAGRFGRMFQTSGLMVNVLYPQGPRDITKMSPHDHDDFQQGWLLLEGECVHHLRWPWTPDLRIWQEDEHVRCTGPSLAVVPPPSLHTTQMTGARNLLIDIFSPPRRDFRDEGWVLNADDYPLPEAR